MMMNYFYGIVDRRKAFSLISRRYYCQRSGFVEWNRAVAITTTPRRYISDGHDISIRMLKIYCLSNTKLLNAFTFTNVMPSEYKLCFTVKMRPKTRVRNYKINQGPYWENSNKKFNTKAYFTDDHGSLTISI